MKKNIRNSRGLPVPTPGLPKEYIERLIAEKSDGLVVQISVSADAVANTLLAETTEDHLLLDISANDALAEVTLPLCCPHS
jgi:hypothetical protein